MYSVFEKLLKERGTNALAVSKATGISTGTLSDWKNGRIKRLKADKLKLIADFFGVSVDYMLTGHNVVEVDVSRLLSDRENHLLSYYRGLSEMKKKIIEDTAKALSEAE